MRERRRRREGEARDHREDRRERHRRDDREQHRPADLAAEVPLAERLGELWCGDVAGLVLVGDRLAADQRRRTEAEGQRHQVERADDADRPEHALAGGVGVGDRVEADQDVRQARRAEHQRDAEREQVQLVVAGLRGVAGDLLAVAQARFEERRALAGLRGGLAEQARQVELERRQHQHRHQGRAGHQQERLDDLDVGGALHAADRHVDDHQCADHDDRCDLGGVGVHAEERRSRA